MAGGRSEVVKFKKRHSRFRNGLSLRSTATVMWRTEGVVTARFDGSINGADSRLGKARMVGQGRGLVVR